MQILGQQKHALWDVDSVEIFPAAYEDNPMRMCGLKAKTFIGSWIGYRGPERLPFVILGIYDFARCKEVLNDMTLFFREGGHVYEMPKE